MPTLAAGQYADVATLRRSGTPLVQRYARILGREGLYRWAAGSQATDDGYLAILPSTGGGAWLLTPDNDRGDDITTATGAATVSLAGGIRGGRLRVIPDGTLTGDVTLTLSPLDQDGNPLPAALEIEILRLDISAYSVTVMNGGGGGGTLWAFRGEEARGVATFDGTNFYKRDAHSLLT